MRSWYLLLCLPLAACGGEPVGGKVPAANPAHVAGVAAAAATLATLADPAAAKHKQEHRGGAREKEGKKVDEVVPEDVLLLSEEELTKETELCEKFLSRGPDEGEMTAEEKRQAASCKEEQEKEAAEEEEVERQPFLPGPDGR
jgi:hypothetical protein